MHAVSLIKTKKVLSGVLSLLAVMGLLGGCAVQEVQRGAALDAHARWALLPIMNHAETPQAGERAQAILATLLRVRGVADAREYAAAQKSEGETEGLPELDAELDERRRFDEALNWAKGQGMVYGITGSVEEWRYKSGADGEPAVGLSLQVIDIATGRVLWSATGARTGWGRESVSGTAQKLLKDLLRDLPLK